MKDREKELEQALMPFADFADPGRKCPSDMVITNGSGMSKRQLTMGDCYHASSLLGGGTWGAKAPRLSGEPDTVEGRLAEMIEGGDTVRFDNYRLSKSDAAKIAKALRFAEHHIQLERAHALRVLIEDLKHDDREVAREIARRIEEIIK